MKYSWIMLFCLACLVAGGCSPSPGGPAVPLPTSRAPQQIDSFEACAQAGYPIMESYPRQCRTPEGQTFTEEIEGLATAEPEDPARLGLAGYPDLPLEALPSEPLSVEALIEHRSALNGQTVTVRGILVATLLGEKACPSDRGMCAQPSLFLADTADEDRDPYYDLRVLVGEDETEDDYPLGQVVQLRVTVLGERTGVVAQKVY